ncbi:hypothetical protein [Rhodococcus sp. (in: high G+C Gram-positive bacteria)]|uniref:nuclear transport factor 2 family protein n=1 Tax=Rhodococcus sp. TaxID=1831 RepID=UPI00257A2628|nr:hypothetical protein [Rhodococcus sp. (in: high G+C Gram-positive bacteria)]MBQ7806857.1 hypothetical protein [Rhodococcus sp. (in: high G+C Gram-positive bacteria)]
MTTPHELRPILDELMEFEPLFHRTRVAMSRDEFDAVVDPEFREIGASGARYTRDYVQSVVERRRLRGEVNDAAELGWTADRPALSRIAPDTYLVTYRLAQAQRVTERSSIWRFTENRWSVLFHQGTVVESGLEA